MNFLAPLMLAGLAAVSLPVLMHLMNRFRARTTDWAAMRFLEISVRRNERRVRLEDLFLLLLRCLLVVLAVLAFAQPVLKGPPAAGSDAKGPVAAVILLDHSASMAQSTGAETRFDQARKSIRSWLDEHESGSMAALFLVSNRTESLMARPEPQFALIRSLLDQAEVTDRGSELVQGIRLACEALQGVSGLPREVHVYTDGQATAWLKSEELHRVAEAHPDVLIKPVWIGGAAAGNLAVVSLKAEGGMPAVRQPCRFLVEVANYGAAPAENVRVTLALDGGAPAAEAMIPQIAPGGTQAVGLVLTFPEAGYHSVAAAIPPDALAADNTRTAAIEVAAQMNVLIVEEDHAGPAMDRDGYFLANALVPTARERAARYYLGAEFVSPASLVAELQNENNLATQAVFLCNLGPVSASVTNALRQFVKSGGNLVVFPGPRTFVEEWQANAAFWDLLPAALEAPAADDPARPPVAWQSSGLTHPVTAFWNDSAQGNLGGIKFHRYFPLKLKTPRTEAPEKSAAPATAEEEKVPTSEPRVISRLVNNEPSVVEWGFGEGNVVLFNSTATPDWNNLPLHPAFVPYLQRLMGHFNRKNESRLVLAPGDTFRKPVAIEWDGREFAVQGPGFREPRSAGRVVSDDSGAFLRFAGTDRAGAYRVTVAGEPAAMFAVQMAAQESDLRLVDQEKIKTALTVTRAPGTPVPATQLVVKQEFWTPLMWLVGAFFLIEAFFAHRLSRARSA
ncbi:BatA domain-containing protein [Verrucomicrobium spinosum]|uniref:BatA domain-containing protein n=2 Tax=Verrucomicrobium spinosum TaxID=2736 RepID=UPI00030581BB|nr:BatA domain-containing protein [Verrucomicrobium spinosum]